MGDTFEDIDMTGWLNNGGDEPYNAGFSNKYDYSSASLLEDFSYENLNNSSINKNDFTLYNKSQSSLSLNKVPTPFINDKYLNQKETYFFYQSHLNEIPVCSHPDYIEDSDNDVRICVACGFEIRKLNFNAEWRKYDNVGQDPSRCHMPQQKQGDSKGIEQVFKTVGISDTLCQSIKNATTIRYNKIVGGDTVRGNRRKALVAICLHFVYYHNGEKRSLDDVRRMFALSRRQLSTALITYYSTYPEDLTVVVNADELILPIVKKLNLAVVTEHTSFIIEFTKLIQNARKEIIESNTQYVAAACLYVYILFKLKGIVKITKSSYAKISGVSDIALTKLIKVIYDLLGLKPKSKIISKKSSN